jgi:hypothetical protein
MVGDWTPLAFLAVVLIPLSLLTRWLSRHLQGVGLLFTGDYQAALLVHYLVLLPGIALHEISHWVAARLVGVKTRGISLHPEARRGGSIRFGAVKVARSDPFRESWIGAAPLLTGVAAILLLARWRFGVEMLPLLPPQTVWATLVSSLNSPDALVWLYLIFAISNAMWPSESDRQAWWAVALLLALAAGTLYLSGWLPRLPRDLQGWVLTAITYLGLAFALAVAVDTVFAAFLFALEKAGEVLLHRHVEY